jgi:hypothetical protein
VAVATRSLVRRHEESADEDLDRVAEREVGREGVVDDA